MIYTVLEITNSKVKAIMLKQEKINNSAYSTAEKNESADRTLLKGWLNHTLNVTFELASDK